ncbi:flagellar biosynthesis protein FliQ [Arenibaculum pallidiluteum]|uniref:flagellar biosynthesis protein FliQ n=1 Tax=Arenibaculum pallidiluteum TaxID=2812559 RepID=UPI001A970BDB|nr:flagellar biosynthesis protein FliQ [Arenibaculum pallidiluteum]
MNATEVIEILRESMMVTIKVAGPVMLITLIVGIAISIFQTLTQIQEATLTFVPKIILVYVALLFLAPFMLSSLITFTQHIMDKIIGLGTGS